MSENLKIRFEAFMSTLLDTNARLDFFTDFEKCYENVSLIKVKLSQLNYLLGQQDLDKAIHILWEENRKCFDVLNILIAVRDKDKKVALDENNQPVLLTDYFKTEEGVKKFINETGLGYVFRNRQITNLVDYVFGVEVGLDTNARKNRSGHVMEGLIANIFREAQIPFRQEIYAEEFSKVESVLGDDSKRFDFVIEAKNCTYLIEVNFYSGGGSKLNEVARSYSEIGPKINACTGYQFVWITDGKGWESAKNKIEEAFKIIPRIYNLTTIKSFIEEIKGDF